MRKYITALVGVGLLAATIAPAAAGGPIMVKDWYNECSANPKDTVGFIKRLTCLRYARGLADGIALWQTLQPDTALICIPATVEALQLIEVGKKFYRDNPKDQHIEAGVLLGLAFQDAWPCQSAAPTVNFK